MTAIGDMKGGFGYEITSHDEEWHGWCPRRFCPSSSPFSALDRTQIGIYLQILKYIYHDHHLTQNLKLIVF